MENKYIVLKIEEAKKHLNSHDQFLLRSLMDQVNVGREAEGKTPNSYIVINKDEPHISEITDIMKKHGHWEGAE
ncbi:hypothetical protein [Bacillus atrophaeus]|uniref:hypothetical protein n=1 Tax=Bacillus atrophaeus TaxID=1452 RepID=UPI00227E3F12|nr:hypothetical protein [Bacillus atrophaeus]MCY8943993.1 hypothetical protein [Bacillus atrophaeus]